MFITSFRNLIRGWILIKTIHMIIIIIINYNGGSK